MLDGKQMLLYISNEFHEYSLKHPTANTATVVNDLIKGKLGVIAYVINHADYIYK